MRERRRESHPEGGRNQPAGTAAINPLRASSRHELYGHPQPVLTCPQCIAILTEAIVWRKVFR